MKKMFFWVVVLALFCAASPLFSQARNTSQSSSGGRTWAIGLDVARTVNGIIAWDSTGGNERRYVAISPSFERGFGNYSLGLRMDMVFGNVGPKEMEQEVAHIAFAAAGRWYPAAPMEKVFVATEIGLNMGYWEKEPVYRGLTFSLRAGYKHIMGKKNRLYIEPSMAYVMTKTDPLIPSPAAPSEWEVGLNVGFTF